MRKTLVNEQQPFGFKQDLITMPATMGNKPSISNRPGATETNGNNGRTVVESFADKNPGAYAQACKGRDNPFAPVGKSFGTGHTNLTEYPSNAN